MAGMAIVGLSGLKALSKVKFEPRVKALMKAFLSAQVERILKGVIGEIPEHEEWQKMYRESLKIYELAGFKTTAGATSGTVGYVIASIVEGGWSAINGARMLIRFSPKDRSPFRAIGKVLEAHGPFAADRVPSLEEYGATPIARRDRADVVIDRRRKNDEDTASLDKDLAEAGAKKKPQPAVIEGKVFFDLPHAVENMEIGHGELYHPHWRPVLRTMAVDVARTVKSAKFMTMVEKYLLRPRFNDWKKSLKVKYPKMHLRDLDGTEVLQEKVTAILT